MPEDSCLLSSLAMLPESEREKVLDHLSKEALEELLHDWPYRARDKQLPPAWDWYIWLTLCGRGGGKTRTGAELVSKWAKEKYSPIALVGKTKADVRDTMVEVGESAILNIGDPSFRPEYEPSKRRLLWPNGVLGIIYSGDEPDQLRGPQHCFVAGTMVATPQGEKPIETIKPGDYVLTRLGERKVIANSIHKDEVGRVVFSNGAELVATIQHPVLQLYGWTRIGELKKGAIVCTGEKLLTDTWQLISRAKRSISIVGYGSSITGQFLKALRYITRIKIPRTTTLPTLNSLRSHHTSARMIKQPSLTSLSVWTAVRRLLESGIIPVTPCVEAASLSGQRKSARPIESVRFAGRLTNQESEIPIEETSVASVVSTWEPVGRAKVYNLTVKDPPEYIANGIIVHNSKAWVDELAKFKYPDDSWSNLMLGLRMGEQPQAIVTTTPRPIKCIKDLVADERTAENPDGRVVVTRGHTLENKANLAPDFLDFIIRKYQGTRLGQQELEGKILDDNPNALWNRAAIENIRLTKHPELKRIVVGIDPEATDTETSAETGIIVAGMAMVDGEEHGYILDDLTIRGSPGTWAKAAITGYYKHKADRIIGEVNNGGDMVGFTIKTVDSKVPFKAVHASRGKQTRAEPVSALYEQGRIHHVGTFPDLEDQLCEWTPGDTSPDRLDALVWAITELMLETQGLDFMVG